MKEFFQNLKTPCQASNFAILVEQKWELSGPGKETTKEKKETIFLHGSEPWKQTLSYK